MPVLINKMIRKVNINVYRANGAALRSLLQECVTDLHSEVHGETQG